MAKKTLITVSVMRKTKIFEEEFSFDVKLRLVNLSTMEVSVGISRSRRVCTRMRVASIKSFDNKES